ncbi:MAG: copper resistance protein NlpE N-terminal domain-containing protein [Wenzhouxiangellaceae bacterium]|nr:copper resistance protein NlpE N-terminal domain-containing protein [Wenzhouxiangellaceae bacterium]
MRNPGLIAISFPLALLLSACSSEPEPSNGESSAAPAAAPSSQIDPPASPTPADSSRLSLDWPGTYSGVIPCASCPGIDTVVTLNADGSFARSMRYIDENPIPITESGQFEWNEAGSKIIVTTSDGETQRYQVGEHRLFQLDQAGNRIEGSLAGHYVLEQHINDPRLEGQRWRLIELQGQPVDAEALQREPFLEFDAATGRMHGNAGCNVINGSYAIKTGLRIAFDERMAMTMMACPDMDTEQLFVEILPTIDNYSLGDDDTMTLNRARMAPLARFVAAEAVASQD